MLNYLIVDDEPRGRELISILLKKIKPECNVIEADSVDEGVRAYLEYKPDLVFLDVEMPNKDGFELVHELVQLNEHPKVVFVTAYNQYAVQAIKASALDYLLKPVSEEDLAFCLNRIRNIQEVEEEQIRMKELLNRLNGNSRIKINSRVGFDVVKANEILYCKADGNYTKVHLINGRKYTTSTTLGIIEEQLSKAQFFRISRSVVINLDFLINVNRKEKLCSLECDGQMIELSLSQKRVQDLSSII